jgi:hypothetical protein
MKYVVFSENLKEAKDFKKFLESTQDKKEDEFFIMKESENIFEKPKILYNMKDNLKIAGFYLLLIILIFAIYYLIIFFGIIFTSNL